MKFHLDLSFIGFEQCLLSVKLSSEYFIFDNEAAEPPQSTHVSLGIILEALFCFLSLLDSHTSSALA